jgi:hypothetical protein
MQVIDRHFLGQNVQIDGNEFIRCRFENSTLVFSAKSSVSMSDCLFMNVTWAFEGAAALTLGFLTAFYQGAGEEGKRLVEQIFENIKHPSAKFAEGVSAIAQISSADATVSATGSISNRSGN